MNAEFTVAVHGLVYLYHKADIISSAELSQNICTNPARVRKVMAKLRRAGLVEAHEGKGSGYRALSGCGEITLLQVLDALGEPAISAAWRSGDIDKECLIASGMGKIMDDVYLGLNERCREELQTITIGTINETIFGQKKTGGK